MRGEAAGLRAFADEVRAACFTHAVLLDADRTGLAPGVMRRMLGVAAGFLELTVLDDTSPAAVRTVTAAQDPRRTLFLVASKSGDTIEVAAFERHFFEWVRATRGEDAGSAFIAVTDPGSALARRAGERGYRRVFLDPPGVDGRYAALSFFGLVPAALIGADPAELLASAARELDEARRDPAGGAGVAFGAAVAEAALAGHDKLTLAFGPRWAPFGAWVEQLVAGSAGRDGRGIVPVDGEAIGPAALAAADRAFVATPDLDRELGHRLAHGAGPAWLLDLEAPRDLGAAFARWEIATVTAAAVLGVDPFDERDEAAAGPATRAVVERALAAGDLPAGEPLARGDGWSLFAAGRAEAALRVAAAREPRAALAALLALGRPGDHVALRAWLHATPAVESALQRLRARVGARSGLATTLGHGPRSLRTTGQSHQREAGDGLFLQVTADAGPDVAIPGARHGFALLRRAQAAAEYAALVGRGRRVARLHLEDDPATVLDRLLGT